MYEVNSITKSMEPKTSSGYDNISNKLVKHRSNAISYPLSMIINLSMDQGIVPKNMKMAKVIPIFKNGKKMNFLTIDQSHYYPVY